MQTALTIRRKILLIALAISAISAIVFTANSYIDQKKAILIGIDLNLRSAAYALPLLLPPNFHDGLNPQAVKPEEYRRILRMLSDYAKRANLVYLYSYVRVGDAFRVASTSATAEEFCTGKETPFFKQYEHPPAKMIRAWDSDTLVFDEYEDEWGLFRSVFIPMRTANGTRFIVGADVTLDFVQARLRTTLLWCLGIGVSTFLAIWLLSTAVLHRILKPVGQLTSFAREMTETEFQFSPEQHSALTTLAVRHQDEVGQLALAFSELEAKLLTYIKDLQETTARKERYESELNIAHNIQMSFLPSTFPAFPEHGEFDLFASLEPAKEVGGDLYDFFLLDDHRLFFYVGDVSDKGVPAALFMTVTKTLIRRIAQRESDTPAAVLTAVNRAMVLENESLMFVTLFCAVLDFTTGELVYSNAGHNPPVLLRADGGAEWLELPDGLVLAVMSDSVYATKENRLGPGDSIILYTDGVTEAMNPERQLYSDDRLLDTIASLAGQFPKETVDALMASVQNHAAGADQSDDITILALRQNPISG